MGIASAGEIFAVLRDRVCPFREFRPRLSAAPGSILGACQRDRHGLSKGFLTMCFAVHGDPDVLDWLPSRQGGFRLQGQGTIS